MSSPSSGICPFQLLLPLHLHNTHTDIRTHTCTRAHTPHPSSAGWQTTQQNEVENGSNYLDYSMLVTQMNECKND